MNVRKPVDYSAMYAALNALMVTGLPQMELYCKIGRLVSGRVEKGAAVAASEYLCGTYPDISGFSPRNLRRMREFYRTYNDAPEVLAQAMTIGWTQNVVILEANLALQERVWYIRAVGQFGWSKLELQRRIEAEGENALDFEDETCYTNGNCTDTECKSNDVDDSDSMRQYLQEPNGRTCDEKTDKEAVGLNYTLMHKDVPVLDMELDESTCSIQKLGTAYHIEHLPLGTFHKNIVDRTELNAWWIDRSIPASRSGVRRALETLDLPNTQLLLTRCFGLSLSDQYWVKPQDSDLQWENINFFCNPFSEDIGDVLLGKAPKTDVFDFSSPDNTSDGYLKKRWKIINGKRCLLKAGSNPFLQQPFNEVIASLIAEHLGIPHVPYSMLWDDGAPYSVCEDFITPDTELVSAWRVMRSTKRDNSVSLYRHYLHCCQSLGVQDIQHAVDQMIVLDYLILNEDRHQNNFGLIRNANTLEWIGASPIFDSGSSLGYDKLPAQILTGRGVECKPFKRTHEEQLKLVSSFDWIDFAWLNESLTEIRTILDQAGEYIDTARRDAILSTYTARLEHLAAMSEVQRQTDDISLDIPQDAAQTYLS